MHIVARSQEKYTGGAEGTMMGVEWGGCARCVVGGSWPFPAGHQEAKNNHMKMYVHNLNLRDLSPIIIPLTRQSSRIFHSWRPIQMNVMVAM